MALLAAREAGYSAHRFEALVNRLRAKVFGRCGLKLPLVSAYGTGYRLERLHETWVSPLLTVSMGSGVEMIPTSHARPHASVN